MNCNRYIHDDLKSDGDMMCPFCDKQLIEVDKVVESCCDEQELETVDGMNVCINCGLVHGYDYVREYLDFYNNMYKIRKKSVYHRNHHIDNVLDNISCENNTQLTHKQRDHIHKVLIEIDGVLHMVNDGRKRMISVKYIIKQLFKMLRLPYKDINVTKSKRTLTYYKQYWKKVQLLIGNRIQSIINK